MSRSRRPEKTQRKPMRTKPYVRRRLHPNQLLQSAAEE